MKRHLFLEVDVRSTVKLSALERKKMGRWLEIGSSVLQALFSEGLAGKTKLKAGTRLSVSLLVCGDSKIRNLNREHRNKDKTTDVLSFPAHEGLRHGIGPQHYDGAGVFLGDLAICWPQTQRQARQFGVGTWDEFIHLFFHGLLHLLEYDHELSAKEERLMQKWEDRAIELFSKYRA